MPIWAHNKITENQMKGQIKAREKAKINTFGRILLAAARA